MAVRRLFIYLGIPFIIITAVLGLFISESYRGDDSVAGMATGDTVSVELPADEKAAQKLVKQQSRTLAKLKPSRPYIVIDTYSNRLYYRDKDKIILEAECSTGHGAELVDSLTGRHWIFNTPAGYYKVNSKLKQPWWRKPDWAFIEEKEAIPKKESERYDAEMMGDYAIGFGDGLFIHGTIYERLLGVSVTHGCVRLGSEDLKKLYEKVTMGTPIYIF